MRLFMPLLLAGLLTAADGAQATYYVMSCKAGGTDYQLLLDDEAGTMVSILGKSETQHVFRSLRKENGAITASGFVAGRGTDFTFSYRYEATITYSYGNGGKRVDTCKLVSQR
jgi:hypothetical protein